VTGSVHWQQCDPQPPAVWSTVWPTSSTSLTTSQPVACAEQAAHPGTAPDLTSAGLQLDRKLHSPHQTSQPRILSRQLTLAQRLALGGQVAREEGGADRPALDLWAGKGVEVAVESRCLPPAATLLPACSSLHCLGAPQQSSPYSPASCCPVLHSRTVHDSAVVKGANPNSTGVSIAPCAHASTSCRRPPCPPAGREATAGA